MWFSSTTANGSPRWKRNQRLKCDCGGYHFPHRRGGGICHTSKTRELLLAMQGGSEADVFAARHDLAVKLAPSTDGPCPF